MKLEFITLSVIAISIKLPLEVREKFYSNLIREQKCEQLFSPPTLGAQPNQLCWMLKDIAQAF